jgi:hypothetical protein
VTPLRFGGGSDWRASNVKHMRPVSVFEALFSGERETLCDCKAYGETCEAQTKRHRNVALRELTEYVLTTLCLTLGMLGVLFGSAFGVWGAVASLAIGCGCVVALCKR